MSLASDFQATALELLSELGQSISVTRDNVGNYTPADGTVTEQADTNYTGYGYPDNYNSFFVDGTLIKQDDVQLYFYSATEPRIDDLFTVGTKVYTALNVEKITVTGSNVMYIVQLRQ